MFSLWTAWVQRQVLDLYNYEGLCPVSTETSSQFRKAGVLYHQNTPVLPGLVHDLFNGLTGKGLGLYPQSTEPITTTTLI